MESEFAASGRDRQHGRAGLRQTRAAWFELPPREIAPEDWERYRGYVAEIFGALGMELDYAGHAEHARAVPASALRSDRRLRRRAEATDGVPGRGQRPARTATSQIIEGPIAFQSLCEHHALPFHGFAHIGYIAGDQIIGISKLTRLVRLFARRFTVQERLGEQIADALVDLISPRGVAVHLEASHLCTQMRGVEEHSRTITTFWRGAFQEPELRREFLDEVRNHRRSP